MVARMRGGERVGDVDRQMGAGRQTASKRAARARRGEPMTDRASGPASPPPPTRGRWRASRTGGGWRALGRGCGSARGAGTSCLHVAVERIMTDNGPGYRSRLFNESLEAYMDHYNWDRPHGACGGLPPVSRIVGVNNVLARNSS